MEIDFEFQKERKIGDFLQGFVDLLKVVLSHFVATILRVSIIPLSITIVIYYFLSTKITFSSASESFEDFSVLGWVSLLVLTLLLLIGYVYSISIEYFILLKNKKSTNFNSQDLLQSLWEYRGYYLRFFFFTMLVLIIIAIPALIIMFVLLLIPIFGTFAFGIFISTILLWFFCAFLFYREGYFSLSITYKETFQILKKNIIQYGIATYIVSFVFQVVMMMLTFIPGLIIGLISYNFLEFDSSFFDGSFGKLIMTIGALLATMLTIFLYMGGVLANGIIYETAKDNKYGIRIYRLIESLGGRNA